MLSTRYWMYALLLIIMIIHWSDFNEDTFASVLQTYTKQFRCKFVRVQFFSQDDFIDLKKPSDNYVYMCFFVFVSGT